MALKLSLGDPQPPPAPAAITPSLEPLAVAQPLEDNPLPNPAPAPLTVVPPTVPPDTPPALESAAASKSVDAPSETLDSVDLSAADTSPRPLPIEPSGAPQEPERDDSTPVQASVAEHPSALEPQPADWTAPEEPEDPEDATVVRDRPLSPEDPVEQQGQVEQQGPVEPRGPVEQQGPSEPEEPAPAESSYNSSVAMLSGPVVSNLPTNAIAAREEGL